MNKNIIATSFYHTDGESVNLGHNKDKNKIYYQCITVFFESVRQFNDCELILFTNRMIPDESGLLNELNVKQIIISDTSYVDCKEVNNIFPGCLFKLDVINYLNTHNFNTICLFDNDCVFQNNIDAMISKIETGYFAGVEICKDIDYDLNGQTIRILSDFINKPTNEFTYIGGEFIGFNKELCTWLNSELHTLWKSLLGSYLEKNFVDEHLISLLFNICDHTYLDPLFIKRHWTSVLYDNTDGTEHEYNVLHLPAEKNRYFTRKYESLCKTMMKHT